MRLKMTAPTGWAEVRCPDCGGGETHEIDGNQWGVDPCPDCGSEVEPWPDDCGIDESPCDPPSDWETGGDA